MSRRTRCTIDIPEDINRARFNFHGGGSVHATTRVTDLDLSTTPHSSGLGLFASTIPHAWEEQVNGLPQSSRGQFFEARFDCIRLHGSRVQVIGYVVRIRCDDSPVRIFDHAAWPPAAGRPGVVRFALHASAMS